MDLHRAGRQAEWAKVSAAEHTTWQHIAARTGGIVTPGNAISVLGLLLVWVGLWQLLVDNLGFGLVLVIFGRLADLADGLVAGATRTKSPLGEIIDATCDKLSMLPTLLVLAITNLAPVPIVLLVLVANLALITLGVRAKFHNRQLHPSRSGKIATALQWLALVSFVAGSMIWHDNNTLVAIIVWCTAWLLTAAALALASFAIFGYVRAYYMTSKGPKNYEKTKSN